MLLVRPSGARSWLLRIQFEGKRQDIGLGSFKDVSLSEARERAAEARKQVRAGVNLVEKRKSERKARREIPTFEQAAEQAHAELVAGWRNAKHRADWISSLRTYAFPHIGSKRIDQLDAPAVRDLLLPIWIDKPETARRVRQRVRGVIDWTVGKGFRAPLDLSGINRSLPRQPKAKSHFAAMPYADVPAFVETLQAADETMGRLALQFLILNASRSGEVRGALRREFDLEAGEWTVPASRMKAGVEHVVPLSGAATAILRRVIGSGLRPNDLVFPGRDRRPLSDMTLSKIMRDMKSKYTVHGFRSSFKDWASECTSFPDAVSEAALAHGDPDKVRAAYRRTDFRKLRADLMAAWANYIVGADTTVRAIGTRRKAL